MVSIKFLVVIGFALLLPYGAFATVHIVGDNNGWTPNFDYRGWAATKVFQVGDSLVFKYKAGYHNVLKVNQTSFQQCIKSDVNGNPPLTSGNDIVLLKTPGMKWYICGVSVHCSAFQQKLAINVLETDPPSPAPTAASPAPPSNHWPSLFSIRGAFLRA